MSENGKYASPDYDAFLEDAEKDNRVGDHDFLVEKVIPATWPSGDPRIDVEGVLLTANRADVRMSWSPPPPASVLKSESGSYDAGKKKAIAGAIRIARDLSKHYGKADPSELTPGDTLRVKTVKTKIKTDGAGGFIRVIAILPPGSATSADSSGPAF